MNRHNIDQMHKALPSIVGIKPNHEDGNTIINTVNTYQYNQKSQVTLWESNMAMEHQL